LTHFPATHAATWPTGAAGHTLPQAPQFCSDIWMPVHIPLHIIAGGMQTVMHVPPTHLSPALHALPH
jgi:hypothetical protein